MSTRLLAVVALASALAAGCGVVGDDAERHAAVVAANCLDCHNSAEKVAGLDLETLKLAAVASNAEVWENVTRKLRAGMMPPAGGPMLDPHARDALVAWIEHEVLKKRG